MFALAPLLIALLLPAPPVVAPIAPIAPIAGMGMARTLRHPHYPKTVELALGFAADADRLSVSHLTVTFDKDGCDEMAVGGAWHLANAHFKTPIDLTVGGVEVAAGDHRLLARKLEGGDWELVLDPVEGQFSSQISDEARALETRFLRGQPISEHLRVDLQPAGDDSDTTLYLEVHFDEYSARALIELE